VTRAAICICAIFVPVSIGLAGFTAYDLVAHFRPTDSIVFRICTLLSFPLLFLCAGAWAVIRAWELSNREEK
jgi:uncharacterized membrane protein YuzA (DUF378 family)